MNSKQAKQFNFANFLNRIGHQPKNIKNNNVWYISPFRPNEKKPSFKVDTNKNYWYDFGIGTGGTIIDFVMRLLHTNDISSVLKYIQQHTNWRKRVSPILKQNFSFQKQKEEMPKTETFISPIKDKVLLHYLKSRGISEIYTSYLRQATIFKSEKHYVALAFRNDKGGYELRNKYFKGCTSKDLSTIHAVSTKPIYVFEGFFDYPSFCELGKKSGEETLRQIKEANVIILNSVALLDKAINTLKSYNDIRLFLDNDDAGATSTQKIMKALPTSQDFSDLYKPYKDLNEFLLKTNKSNLPNFTSRCAIVRTETKVQSRNGNLAFTPDGRKRDETIPKGIVSKKATDLQIKIMRKLKKTTTARIEDALDIVADKIIDLELTTKRLEQIERNIKNEVSRAENISLKVNLDELKVLQSNNKEELKELQQMHLTEIKDTAQKLKILYFYLYATIGFLCVAIAVYLFV